MLKGLGFSWKKARKLVSAGSASPQRPDLSSSNGQRICQHVLWVFRAGFPAAEASSSIISYTGPNSNIDNLRVGFRRFDTLYKRRHVSAEMVRTVLQAHAEGSSLRGVSRISGVAYNTSVSLIRATSQKGQLVHNAGVGRELLQLDVATLEVQIDRSTTGRLNGPSLDLA
jgi:hypothetical protein